MIENYYQGISTDEKIEIDLINELIQACLEEEGYKIAFEKSEDEYHTGFTVTLKNGCKIFIKLVW